MSDDNEKKTAEFYERLKTELDNSNSWPAQYLFKFIVPTNEENILKVENLPQWIISLPLQFSITVN